MMKGSDVSVEWILHNYYAREGEETKLVTEEKLYEKMAIFTGKKIYL